MNRAPCCFKALSSHPAVAQVHHDVIRRLKRWHPAVAQVHHDVIRRLKRWDKARWFKDV